MKIIYWNARGIANENTQQVLTNLVHRHKPFLVCLSEPFVPISSIHVTFWCSLGLSPFTTNDRGLLDPNIWFLCHHDFRSVMISASSQQITVSGSLDGLTCTLTAVYAKTTIFGRRQLWQELSHIHTSYVNGPWVVFGDFNCVFGAHEKRGGNPPSFTSCYDFQQMCTSCNLLDVVTKGLSYTWTNQRTYVRLDRALANLEWLEAWSFFECHTLTLSASDHCPNLLTCFQTATPFKSPFKFQNMWLKHPDFLQLIREFWGGLQVVGCPMFVLASNLRALMNGTS